MKIMIINPNSSDVFTSKIQECALEYANGKFEVVTVKNAGAPNFIDTFVDRADAATGMLELVRRYEKEVDGFVIACHCDPNLDAIKEMTDKVVVGIGEASMKIATMLGHSFSVVCTGKDAVSIKKMMVEKYSLEKSLASIRYPHNIEPSASVEEKLLKAAQEAVFEDRAQVIVLGVTGFKGLARRIHQAVQVPVLDGLGSALIIAYGLIEANSCIKE